MRRLVVTLGSTLFCLITLTWMGAWINQPLQQVTLTGKVTDTAGSPLTGATVAVVQQIKTLTQTQTDGNGVYKLSFTYTPGLRYHVRAVSAGFDPGSESFSASKLVYNFRLNVMGDVLKDHDEIAETAPKEYKRRDKAAMGGLGAVQRSEALKTYAPTGMYPTMPPPSKNLQYVQPEGEPNHNTEGYAALQENIFHRAKERPLSTFSIDVDNASYANLRRFINNGQRPPIDAVRIEEMVNYFSYAYPQPEGQHPFSVNTELAMCPWNPKHQLLLVGLQGKKVAMESLPGSNLVFLIDVSGSMSDANKLPLLVASFKLLVQQLRPIDRVAIVVYAGAAGLVLPSTPGNEKETIIAALDRLQAGGSTAGGAGINLAYKTALDNFIQGGNNRVILATDGDFNIGASSDGEMQRLIEEKRNSGVYLTCLGYGMGNYKDSKMETLANKGNGNYGYIDNLAEARRLLVGQFAGTLFTIAKDVKLQLEFNPNVVQAYRLIGYENRLLRDEDFRDDKKDAGELGSGHTVTALYEIVPLGVEFKAPDIKPLKYQEPPKTERSYKDELLTVSLRYKKPGNTAANDESSAELAVAVPNLVRDAASANLRWAAAVAQFGLLLRNSEYKGEATYDNVLNLASGAKDAAPDGDPDDYRSEFIRLARNLQGFETTAKKD